MEARSAKKTTNTPQKKANRTSLLSAIYRELSDSVDEKKFGLACLIFFFSISAQAAGTSDAEKVAQTFRDAKTYTVKIRANVEYAFVEDSTGEAVGAGFLVDPKRSWVLTNAHVSNRNPSYLEVRFHSTDYVPAKLKYVDPYLDLAIIELPAGTLPASAAPPDLDCSNEPDIGSAVGAFGHPHGLDFMGARGIISGKPYTWRGEWLQTDAAINPGNSGGPLIDLNSGKVVGINTAGLDSDISEGIGFAIPIRYACKVLDMLKAGQDPSPPHLPIEIVSDPDRMDGMNVVAIYVDKKSKWPLLEGDKIIGLVERNGSTLHLANAGQLIDQLRQPKESANLAIQRDNNNLTVSVQLQPVPELLGRVGVYFSGIHLAEMKWRDAETTNPNGKLMVQDVKEGTSGRAAGVRAYHFLALLDGKKFGDVRTLCRYLHGKLGQKVTIALRTSGKNYRSYVSYLFEEISVSNLTLTGYRNPNKTCGE